MKRRLLLAVLIGALATLLYAWIVEPRLLIVREIEIADADVPASFEGKRIAFLTDIHHGPSFSLQRVRAVVARTNALHPSNGIGTIRPPVRLFARPQIILINLRRSL